MPPARYMLRPGDQSGSSNGRYSAGHEVATIRLPENSAGRTDDGLTSGFEASRTGLAQHQRPVLQPLATSGRQIGLLSSSRRLARHDAAEARGRDAQHQPRAPEGPRSSTRATLHGASTNSGGELEAG